LLGYFLIKPQYSNAWLLGASLIFYYIGAKNYLKLLLLIIGLAYISGLLIAWFKEKWMRIIIMTASVSAMIFTMAYFKYYDFVVDNINAFFHTSYSLANMVLPIGISFFVFQAISYVVDVYRGELYLKNPIDMALYISFFPQLIAGPIVRFHDIREYLGAEYRKFDFDNFTQGIWRFSIGLCKKVIIANNLGTLSDIVFGATDIYTHSVLYTWLGAIAYTLQIYYDFSGYSDMAIGLGKVFGFEFQENFNYPYSAKTIKEFWRRWHMSLSQFFRDYVYIPLGGNRCSKARWLLNMMAVWFLTGIWHGASWTYILWGVIYGIIIIAESFIPEWKHGNKITGFLQHVYTMVVVCFLWVLFRAKDIAQSKDFFKNMIGMGNKNLIDSGFLFLAQNYLLVIVLAALLSVPIIPAIRKKFSGNAIIQFGAAVVLMIGVLISVSFIYMGSYNPFLYFMF
jgi:D-alanyl-lipoteichoic acid acyltransferase DltB (MBOAT superfamily)